MGIYIPNMKMPKSCNECMSECINIPLECYPDGDTIPNCPLIEIDDELFKKAESAYVLQQIRSR